MEKGTVMFKRTLVTFTALLSLTAMAPAAFAAKSADTHVMLTTSAGNIELELDNAKAPVSVNNFVDCVIPGFMVQGGGFTGNMQQKTPNPPIKNEADNGLRNLRGTISMARTSDPNSATSQFFLNVADNAFLDHGQTDFGYAVFGKVIKGMDVVDKISSVKTDNVGPYQNVPATPIVILSAKVLP
jgi:peptidyl-prolyl cis-trans isomerase A (cyclophilin A)